MLLYGVFHSFTIYFKVSIMPSISIAKIIAILIIQHCGTRATRVSKSFYFEQNFKTCLVGE